LKKKQIVFVLILAAVFVFTTSQFLLAGESKVKLTVPGCVWPGTAARVSSILKGVDGVSNFNTDTKNHSVTVWFDDEKTDVSAIEKALADGGFPVKGEAQFLK